MSDRLSLNDLRVLLAEGQVRSAAARYLGELEGNPIRDREDPDAMELAFFFLADVLPSLIKQSPGFLALRPEFLTRSLSLVSAATDTGYRPAACRYLYLQLLCLSAVANTLQGRISAGVTFLQKAMMASRDEAHPIFPEVPDAGKAETVLDLLFRRSMDQLGKGKEERAILTDLRNGCLHWVTRLREDFRVAGRATALFVSSRGALSYPISVKLESSPSAEIRYLLEKPPWLDASLLETMQRDALQWAHEYLVRMGYREGLRYKKVSWIAEVEEAVPVDGDSAGLALAVAIISAYLDFPVPVKSAFSGRLGPYQGGEGHILSVEKTVAKVCHASEEGFELVFIPRLSPAEAGEVVGKSLPGNRIRQVLHFHEVTEVVFAEAHGFLAMKGVLKRLRDILFSVRNPPTSPERPFSERSARWLFTLFFLTSLVFALEGAALAAFREGGLSYRVAVGFACVAFVPVFLCLMLSLSLSETLLRRGWRNSWLLSVLLMGLVVMSVWLFLSSRVTAKEVDYTTLYDFPIRINSAKDLGILFLFVCFYLLNMVYVVQAGDFLVQTKQETTLSRCRGHAHDARTMLPIRTLPVRAHQAGLFAIILGSALIVGEFVWWSSFRPSFPHGSYLLASTVARDIVIILTASLLHFWYYDKYHLEK